MVAANFVRLFPVSYFSEPLAQTPIRFSPTQFSELLPASILEHYRGASKVQSLERHNDRWIVHDELQIGRAIAIQFGEDYPSKLYLYHLLAQEYVNVEDESQIGQFRLSLPNTPPLPEQFAIWLTQSINSAAHEHFKELFVDLSLAVQCQAMYLTNSPFAASLLDTQTNTTPNLRADTTQFVVNVDVPFFKNVSAEEVMRARMDTESFNLFRRELETQFRELRLEKDPVKLKIKVENAMHELTEVQATKVTRTINKLHKTFVVDATLAVAGMVGTVATSGLSLLATIIGMAQGYKVLAEFQDSVRENPAYFLWKVKRS